MISFFFNLSNNVAFINEIEFTYFLCNEVVLLHHLSNIKYHFQLSFIYIELIK